MSGLGIPPWWPHWRRFLDRAVTTVITAGGGVVLVTIFMLFAFLIYEIAPLVRPAVMEFNGELQWGEDGNSSRWLSLGEYGEVALRLDAEGKAEFRRIEDDVVIRNYDLSHRAGISAVADAGPDGQGLALGYGDGSVRVLEPQYRYQYRGGSRSTDAELVSSMQFSDDVAHAQPVTALALSPDSRLLVQQHADGRLFLGRKSQEAGMGASATTRQSLGRWPAAFKLHLLDDNRWLILLLDEGEYVLWSLSAPAPEEPTRGRLFPEDIPLADSTVLQGSRSLVVAHGGGEVTQFQVLRREGGPLLQALRGFDVGGEQVTRLLPERRRRGFLAFSEQSVQWFSTTAGIRSLRAPVDGAGSLAAISPRADRLLLATGGVVRHWRLINPHPEVSLTSLWRQVWYEGYPEPDWVYQSSGSGNETESKYSLTPLAFGTLKAAFYTMLLATPVAIGGAVYTAFFMSARLRRRIKPTIELMEALPTVILGFLAGLWLAPLVEENLTGFIALLLTLPLGVLVFALLFFQLPAGLRSLVPEGWHAMMLLPVVAGLVWLSLSLGSPRESLVFGGDAQRWFADQLGLAYSQRNAVVVGIAMGVAVIPTIYSIAEDAIYSVPRNLSYGSLALGATPWQTLTGVVLPTASPGVFSAVMIGFGRAVGETMIVLMATGNTPIMDLNLFEGMRTLAANIATEVPEAAVDSTHYRVLFLTAFLLFAFTFGVNTLAEVIRQRLRARYGALG